MCEVKNGVLGEPMMQKIKRAQERKRDTRHSPLFTQSKKPPKSDAFDTLYVVHLQ